MAGIVPCVQGAGAGDRRWESPEWIACLFGMSEGSIA